MMEHLSNKKLTPNWRHGWIWLVGWETILEPQDLVLGAVDAPREAVVGRFRINRSTSWRFNQRQSQSPCQEKSGEEQVIASLLSYSGQRSISCANKSNWDGELVFGSACALRKLVMLLAEVRQPLLGRTFGEIFGWPEAQLPWWFLVVFSFVSIWYVILVDFQKRGIDWLFHLSLNGLPQRVDVGKFSFFMLFHWVG